MSNAATFNAAPDAISLPSTVIATPAGAQTAAKPTSSRLGRFFKFSFKASLVVVLLCAIAAIAIMFGAYHMADGAGSTHGSMVVLGDDSVIAMMNDGAPKAVVAWVAITAGLFIAFLAVLFAFGAATLAIGFALTVIALVGLLMAAPALIIFALLVWILRKAFGSSAAAKV
jgi:hypothetical protein